MIDKVMERRKTGSRRCFQIHWILGCSPDTVMESGVSFLFIYFKSNDLKSHGGQSLEHLLPAPKSNPWMKSKWVHSRTHQWKLQIIYSQHKDTGSVPRLDASEIILLFWEHQTQTVPHCVVWSSVMVRGDSGEIVEQLPWQHPGLLCESSSSDLDRVFLWSVQLNDQAKKLEWTSPTPEQPEKVLVLLGLWKE